MAQMGSDWKGAGLDPALPASVSKQVQARLNLWTAIESAWLAPSCCYQCINICECLNGINCALDPNEGRKNMNASTVFPCLLQGLHSEN